MTTLRVNRLHHPVTALGHGVRAGIWLQGCTIGCAGCESRHTWDPAGGADVRVEDVLGWLDTLPGDLDGLTVSGGEPFQQAPALAELLADVRCRTEGRDFDILVYSGYAWPRLSGRDDCAAALRHADAVVAGPYVAARNTDTPLRGSDNQEIVALTPLGRRRYGDPAALTAQGLQVTVDGDSVRLIGIPRRGDLERIQSGLAARGVTLEAVTWQG